MGLPSKVQQWQNRLAPVLARWGTYCASHQIQVLLTDCLLLTCIVCLVWPFDILPSLSWPGTPQEDASPLSSAIALPARDLLAQYGIDATDNPMCLKAWPAVQHQHPQTHLVQVIVQPGEEDPAHGSEHGMLDKNALHQILRLQQSISAHLLTRQSPPSSWRCIPSSHSSSEPPACLMLSPLQAWDHRELDLLSDDHLIATLSSAPGLEGMFGKDQDRTDIATSERADQIVVTFFLENPDVLSPSSSNTSPFRDPKVLSQLQQAVAPFGHLAGPHRPALSSGVSRLVLKPAAASESQENVHPARWTPLSDPTVWGYALVAVYAGYTMRRMDRVHSRLGLLFTALVTMATSTLLSLAVCKILRFSVDGIPWKLIPLLITVLAVDNTFVLTHAVVSTPVEWPIPQRIGQGLAKVGPSIFLALVVEHLLLFAAWAFIPVRSVREMVLLAAVALKADAAMQITLFLPVLSIDIQRLELSDLLRLGRPQLSTSLTSHEDSGKDGRLNEDKHASYAGLISSIWDGAKDRIARSVAFLAISLLNFGMYWVRGADYFLPAFCQSAARSSLAPPSASALWPALNANNLPVTYLSVSAPGQILLSASGPSAAASMFTSVFSATATLLLGTIAPAVTMTAALYLLLHQLLRDKEFLAAEKLKAAEERRLAEKAAADATAPRARGRLVDYRTSTDIELLASSSTQDPLIAIWAVMSRHITLFRPDQAHQEATLVRLELPPSSAALQQLAIDQDGRFCAAADRMGHVYIWDVSTKALLTFEGPQGHASEDLPAVSLLFSGNAQNHNAPPLPGQAQKLKQRGVTFFAAQSDGSVQFWDCLQATRGESIPPLENQVKKIRFHLLSTNDAAPTSNLALARSHAQGPVEIWRRTTDGSWTEDGKLSVRSADGAVCSMTAVQLPTKDSSHSLLITGSTKGLLSIWEQVGQAWPLVAETQASSAPIRQLRALGGFNASCDCSPTVPSIGFALVYETAAQLTAQRIFQPASGVHCRCQKLTKRDSSSEALFTPSIPTNSTSPEPSVQSSESTKLQEDGSSGLNSSASASSSYSILPRSQSAASPALPTSSTLALRSDACRRWDSDVGGIWEQQSQTSILCGLQKASAGAKPGSWQAWSLDLQGADKLSSALLYSDITTHSPLAPPDHLASLSSTPEKAGSAHASSILRNRKASPRRRQDPLNDQTEGAATTPDHAPQILFSSIRGFSKAGPAVAATFGNSVVLIDPPPRSTLMSKDS